MKKIIFILVLMTLFVNPVTAQLTAQQKRHEQLARLKAQRLAKMRLYETTKTPNQDQFDVKYYGLDLTMDPALETISGSVAITAEVVGTSINQMDLNLANNMTVSSVSISGSSVNYTHQNHLLTIDLDRTYNTTEQVTVIVSYSGKPGQTGFGAFGFDTHNGQPMIWSLSEPYGAREWWPCKDFPRDKADSADIKITVPSNLTVASNGTLKEVTTSGNTKTYWWHESYPITTYLISVAIHPYTTFSHYYNYSPSDSMEVQYYVFPDHYDDVQENYGKTVEMIEAFSTLFGQYPFINEKYGHAEFVWGGGMEHQTITSLGGWGEFLIAHELAHQWWGDMITCKDFHHIWLNEGFATYSEALWAEYRYGTSAYFSEMNYNQYYGPGTIYVPDLTDVGRIFHGGLSYAKASWVLHMLRHVVGDSTFFDILKAYYADNRYQYNVATTEDFRDLCESVSGMELDFFFQQWIYEEYYPTYSYQWSYNQIENQYLIDLTIKQTQANTLFKMPIDITVETTSGEQTFVVWDSLATQSFQLSTDSQPTVVYLDKEGWILKRVQSPIVNPTFDKGILLVNGVNFDVYGNEIRSAYQDKAFWGDFSIDFWDCFDEPTGGYPSTLPAPLGHGNVPSDILKQYSSLVWVGNDYRGDLDEWYNTSILSYLEAGGNVLLMTRKGQNFIDMSLRNYLGINWAESETNAIYNCIATYPGLVSMSLIGNQSYNAVFNTNLTNSESTLLFKETASFSVDRGLGVWRKPANGGTYKDDGGQFVFISGRPYRYNHNQLKTNVEYILENFFGESVTDIKESDHILPQKYYLEQNYPNPFNSVTKIKYDLPNPSQVTIEIYNILGEKVITLVNEYKEANYHSVIWRAKNFPSGIYFYRIKAGKFNDIKKMIILK